MRLKKYPKIRQINKGRGLKFRGKLEITGDGKTTDLILKNAAKGIPIS
jgi:hypothetical protein